MNEQSLVIIGQVGAPYGVRGWVHVRSFTDPPDNLLQYLPLSLQIAGQAWREIPGIRVEPHGADFRAHVPGVDDRDAASTLKGAFLGVVRNRLPATEDDEYYWRDLVGAQVEQRDGRVLGAVRELLETGADDVLVIDPPGAPDAPQILIPFHRKFVQHVDLKEKKIIVEWEEPV